MNRVHGYCGTRTYNAWKNNKSRCHNFRHTHFPLFGDQGILFCKRWDEGEMIEGTYLTGFECFLLDMGPCPKGHRLARKDTTKGFCKENCAWRPPVHMQFIENSKLRVRTNHEAHNARMRLQNSYKQVIDKFLKVSEVKLHGLNNQYLYFPEGEFYVRSSFLPVEGEVRRCFQLANVTVKPKYRKTGVFKAFWEAAKEACKERGLVLYLENANNPILQEAMERWGVPHYQKLLGFNYYLMP